MLLASPCIGFVPVAPPSALRTPLISPGSRVAAHLHEMKLDENGVDRPWWKRRQNGMPTGTLILLRHGETEVPRGTSFIGWSDPDLNQRGEQGTTEAARAIREAGFSFDVAYTSVLKRAVRTTWLLLQELDKIYLPVWKHWRLNERCYGALTAESIDSVQKNYGEATVASWRRNFDAKPPPYEAGSKHNPMSDPRYHRWQDRRGNIRQISFPNGETLGDVCERVTPVWKREILQDLRRGRNVLVVAHGNTLRAIVQAIDDLDDDELRELEIPPCIPLVYRFERKGAIESLAEGAADTAILGARLAHLQNLAATLRRRLRGGKMPERDYDIVPIMSEASAGGGISGEFLAKASQLAEAQERVRSASMARYGIDDASAQNQLKRNAGAYGAFMTPANSADAVSGYSSSLASAMPLGSRGAIPPPSPPVAPSADSDMIGLPGGGAMVTQARPPKRQQHVVIIRHGKTEHNKLGLFTGWEDVSLAKEGRAEATAAGKLLQKHGVTFDVVYTSWLSRAIETAWLVLVELDAMWLPIHKSWRLNERMCVHTCHPLPTRASPHASPCDPPLNPPPSWATRGRRASSAQKYPVAMPCRAGMARLPACQRRRRAQSTVRSSSRNGVARTTPSRRPSRPSRITTPATTRATSSMR